MQKHVLAMIMAGGKGSRLFPLTEARAKPAVPFGGKYRIVDFALSNFVNSGIYSIYVLTQFKSQSLGEHLQQGWSFGSMLRDHFILPVPAQMQAGETWYRGTADAIFQNLNLVRETRPDLVCVFGGDHIYRMDVSQMVAFHESRHSDITVAATTVPVEEASAFGVIGVDSDWRITRFQEKPTEPATLPGDPTRSLVSMGNYIFSRQILEDVIQRDAEDAESSHDFGKDVLPACILEHQVHCYDFTRNAIPGQTGPNTYWRDVGTIESYFDANMDLREIVPEFNLYNRNWPIRTTPLFDAPAKFVHDENDRVGHAVNSLVCGGTIVSGASVRNSIIGRNVKIRSFAEVTDCIVMDNAEIGPGARLSRVIVDKNNLIPDGAVIDSTVDAGDNFVSPSGIVVIRKRPRFESTAGIVHF